MTDKFIHTIGILDASDRGSWELVGGIPLIARYIYYFVELGIKEAYILVSKDTKIKNISKWTNKWKDKIIIYEHICENTFGFLSQIQSNILYINTSFLIDKRIIEKIYNSSPTTIFLLNEAQKNIFLGIFDKDGLRLWAEKGLSGLLDTVCIIRKEDIDTFSVEIRGNLEPYIVSVKNKKDANKATLILIKNMQKKVMDLPAEWIDPFFENYLTYILCKTPITPNIVTIFSLFIAIIIAILFYNGYFLLGAFSTYIVEVLDGVDGKLARTKLQFSKFGEYECVVDYFYENLWYISLGIGLKRVFCYDFALFVAGIIVFCDTLDNIIYTLANKWLPKNLDLMSPFDMTFRRIAGRRNIYCFMFMIGFLMQYYIQTFLVVSIWSVITVSVHILRLIHHKRNIV